MKLTKKKAFIILAGIAFGLFIGVQSRSYEDINEFLLRDSENNAFAEIQILKEKNKSLNEEISQLELNLEQLTDQNLALNAVEKEIQKYLTLSGRVAIFGPGVTISIKGPLTTPWIVDLVNEFFNSGAQAVSINGIRIVDKTAGFDTLPQGQILLNGSILSSPYELNAIGEPSVLNKILNLPGGILERLEVAFPNVEMTVNLKEIIKID